LIHILYSSLSLHSVRFHDDVKSVSTTCCASQAMRFLPTSIGQGKPGESIVPVSCAWIMIIHTYTSSDTSCDCVKHDTRTEVSSRVIGRRSRRYQLSNDMHASAVRSPGCNMEVGLGFLTTPSLLNKCKSCFSFLILNFFYNLTCNNT
jgi:hypothetical protein